MKKIFSLWVAPVLMAGLLFSCKPEQSELSIDSLPGTATVIGKVEYNPGVSQENGAVIYDKKLPAAGRTVLVKVNMSEFTNSSSEENESFRTFQATTDAQGRYSVQVPVGFQPVSARVTAVSFIGNKTAEDAEGNIITIENAVFNVVDYERVTLEDQCIAEANLLMVSETEQDDVVYNQKVNLKGSVFAAKEVRDNEEDMLDIELSAYATNLIARVEITNGYEVLSSLKYDISSNAKGEYSLDMMLPNNCWNNGNSIRVKVSKEISMDENFKHYYREVGGDWRTQTIKVFYGGEYSYVSSAISEQHKFVPVDMPALELYPTAAEPEKVHGIGREIDEDAEEEIEVNNPFNW
ncbi:MAG: hypothetical protein NC048_05535 [Bacteroides sp.]|nr:hypothetical protein [Ruminococcus flavefaciens]MCM1554939.1 hypothetical protein [Bacteroides sp.]